MKRVRLSRLKTQHFIRLTTAALTALLVIGYFYYWWLGIRAEKTIAEQVNAQKLTLARSGGLAISEFLEDKKADLLFLAEIESIKKDEEEEAIKTILALGKGLKAKGEISGDIVRVDKEGLVIWGINVERLERYRGEQGVSVADRDYFVWAKGQEKLGMVFVGQPVTSRGGFLEGKWVTTMATPVFYQDEFNGLVFMNFLLEDLAQRYVSPAVFSPETHSMLLSQDGVVIASDVSGTTGENVYQYIEEDKEEKEQCLAMMEKAFGGLEGNMVHRCWSRPLFGQSIKVVSAYAPIRIGEQTWSLFISSPYEKVVELALPLKSWQFIGLASGLIGAVILAILFVFSVRVAQRDGFINGFEKRSRRKKKIKKRA